MLQLIRRNVNFSINFKSPLIPLLLLVMIDHIGFGIFFPILVPVFTNDNGILGPNASLLTKDLWYNITLAVFPIALYFGAIILGALSDIYGRKKILLICLLGAVFSYALAGIAIDIKSLTLLIISRAIAGLTAGSMPIAQAAVIDISDEKQRTSNLGVMILACSLGFTLGPLLGGFCSDNTILSWFSYSTPFYAAAMLALVNFGFLNKFFEETFIPNPNLRKTHHFKWTKFIEYGIAPIVVKPIRYLSCIFLLWQLGWSFYFQTIALYLQKKYQFSSQDISMLMFFMGLGFAIGSTWGVRLLARYFNEVSIAFVMLLISTICTFYTTLEGFGILGWISAVFLGITIATIYSLTIKFFSLTVSSDQQGWIMGVTEAIVAIAWVTAPLLSTYLSAISLVLPFQIATIAFVLSAILLKFWKLPVSEKSEAPEQTLSSSYESDSDNSDLLPVNDL